jgi:hypothetical protein
VHRLTDLGKCFFILMRIMGKRHTVIVMCLLQWFAVIKFKILALYTSGYRIRDHGDLELDDLPNDTPMYNIKMPRSVSKNSQQVRHFRYDLRKNKETVL